MKYNEKFAGLLKAIETAQAEHAGMLVVNSPLALGDDYTELVESLNRIAEAGLALQIVPQTRGHSAQNLN